jgi:hypothetical protein
MSVMTEEACPVGAAIPQLILATPARHLEGRAGEAAMAVAAMVAVEAIDQAPHAQLLSLIYRKRGFGSRFNLPQGSVWNRLKRRFFLLHPAAAFNIDGIAYRRALPFP